jgi:NRPS condensation-like uncharacterized protein
MSWQQQNYRWYKLDNAAKIYPAISQKNWNSTFRLSAALDEEICPETLVAAVNGLKLRFPTFFVQLRMGLFWYYFEPTISSEIVTLEHLYPCSPIEIGHSKLPIFRVLYYKNKISLELFHAAADGSGALVFLKSLIAHYLSLRGHDVDAARWEIQDPRGKPLASESEDSFSRYYQKIGKAKRFEPKAYKYKPHCPVNENYLRIISGSMDAGKLRAVARSYGATVTQYLAALYIRSFMQIMPADKLKRPVRISIPVNLRKHFPSETLRNFSSYINVGVMPNPSYGITEILDEIIPQLKEGLEHDNLLRSFSQNVAAEKNFAMRISPLFVKNIALKLAFQAWGESRYTSSLSNLGDVVLPESISKHVKELGFVLGCSPQVLINLAAITYNGRLTLSFSSRSSESEVQAIFFKSLINEGIEVEVESNE